MKRVLILCVHRPDRSPSQRFRFEQYLSFLEQQGYQFDFSYLLNEADDKAYYKPGQYFRKGLIVLKSLAKRFGNLARSGRYDLVFVQREAFMLGTSFFEKKLARKVPLIFDFDDAIWQHQISEGNKNLAFLKDTSKTDKITAAASIVFCGNEYLAGYARKFNRNVAIVPATIDTDLYQRPDPGERDTVCIGWSGSFTTIEHFKTAVPALKKIRERFGDRVRFKIIGNGDYYSEELQTAGQHWKAATEVQDLADIDIGIMPLPDDDWAKGKCGLKGLQYMSFGIPTLMSPVGVNSEIIQDGQNGFLPATEEQWVDALTRLVEDPALRRRIGAAGRQTVVDKYSVHAWKQKYLYYFNQLTGVKQ